MNRGAVAGQFVSPCGSGAFSAGRRRLYWLIIASYWMLLFEGVLRKWIFPEYQKGLFFIRDPLAILIYLAAWRFRIAPRRSVFLWLGVAFALISIPQAVLQYSIEGPKFSWLLAIYGWRNYFLMLPLPFFIASCLSRSEIDALIRRTLWLTVPIAILVYLQFVSSPLAVINRGSGDEENTFSGLALVQGKIRPLGTFTSNQGQTPFIAAALAMVFIAWVTPEIRSRMGIFGLSLCTCSTLSMLAFSGSRGAVLWCGLIVVFGFLTALVTGKRRSPAPVLIVCSGILFVVTVVLPVVFPQAITAFEDRWETAQHSEVSTHGGGGIFSRALNDLILFRHLLTEDHLEGYQMGIGGNAGYLLGLRDVMMHLTTSEEGFAMESEWGRHVADLGALGVAFILYRVSFTIFLLFLAVRTAGRTGDAHPMLLYGFLCTLLLNGQITGQGSQNGFVWLFVGFMFAVCGRHNRGPVMLWRQARTAKLPARSLTQTA